MTIYGWAGTILCLTGCYLVGCQKKYGFALQFLGCACWCYAGTLKGMWDLVTVETVFMCLYIRNGRSWTKLGH